MRLDVVVEGGCRRGQCSTAARHESQDDPVSRRVTARARLLRGRFTLRQRSLTRPSYGHDFGALRAVSTRVVIGAGAESEGEMTHRAALAVAERLGTEPVIFPSHHGGFLGGEFGWRGDPDSFAVTLRDVLDGR